MLSEEDKTSEPSLRYWFDVVDFARTGIITASAMRELYEPQVFWNGFIQTWMDIYY